MNKEQAEQLIEKYLNGTASAEERQALDASLNQHMEHSDLLRSAKELDRAARHNRKAVLVAIRDTDAHRSPIRRLTTRTLPYAAAIIVAALVGYFAMVGRQPSVYSPGIADIAAGGNRATLTLADGRTISLSEAQTGIVVGEGISYTDGSLVLGEQANRGTSEQVHTLTTPKGGTYQIILPDRSKVWLNANSTLKYPSRFPENERIVELEGEAYFDVSEQVNERSQKTPFRVVSKGQTVEVLGTQFNISAYADDPEIKTTLVEGKVKVALAGSTTDRSPITDHRPPITLSPGEQSTVRARLPGQGAVIGVQQVDVNQYTAWKDGLIILNNADIATVVRQLERWYDVTFEVASWPEGLRLEGELPRNTKLSGIIDALQLNTGKQLYINGRRVMERQ